MSAPFGPQQPLNGPEGVGMQFPSLDTPPVETVPHAGNLPQDQGGEVGPDGAVSIREGEVSIPDAMHVVDGEPQAFVSTETIVPRPATQEKANGMRGFLGSKAGKITAGVAGVALASGAFMATQGGSEDKANKPPVATSNPNPSPSEASPSLFMDRSPDGRLWSEVRSNIHLVYSMENNLVNPVYFSGPNQSIDANVNKVAAKTTLDNLLTSRSAAIVTGDIKDIRLTYARSSFIDQSDPNEFGVVQGQVQTVQAEHKLDAQLVAANPNQPVPHQVVNDILGVMPINETAVTVTAVVTDVSYGKYTPGEPTPEQTLSNIWGYDLEYRTIKSAGGMERTLWVITSQALVKAGVDPSNLTNS